MADNSDSKPKTKPGRPRWHDWRLAEAAASEIAGVLCVNTRRVNQLAKVGTLRRLPSGNFIVGETISAFEQFREGSRIDSEARTGSYANSRARKEAANARLAELDLETKEGKLLDADVVEAAWTDALIRLRGRLLVLPASAGVRLASETDPKKCIALLDQEVREALEELVNDPGYDPENIDEADISVLGRSETSSETEDI